VKAAVPLYPLLLEPIYKEKVWGGRSLERFGRRLPGEHTPIGESWELSDLAVTSRTGGRGEAARTTIRNGPLAKRTVGEVAREFGAIVTGRLDLGEDGGFPLLLKYLDARGNLSVQVHPSAEYAAQHPGAHLKSEAWYVVEADPGAVLYKGIVPGTTKERFAAAIADGSVPELLVAVPALPGDCHYLPSGTCHALGAGILVAEVQTASDTTFRVFDWDRTDRELHIEEALTCIDFEIGPGEESPDEGTSGTVVGDAVGRRLVSCEHFVIEEWRVLREGALPFHGDGSPKQDEEMAVLMLVEGNGSLRWGAESARELEVEAGDTVLIPAALADATLEADGDLTLLVVTGPEPAPEG
jgi:mannose-6-phosphate isomerase